MIVTTNLAKGAVTMARRKTIVKRLNAIQNFGAMDVLCTDKTGTLTQDKVVLERHVNVVGEDGRLGARARVPQQLLPDGAQEPARRRGAGARASSQRELAIDKAYGKVDEIPFDFTRRRMSVVVDHEHRSTISSSARARSRRFSRSASSCTTRSALDAARVLELEDERRDDAQGAGRRAERGRLPRRRRGVPRLPDQRTAPYTVADESDLMLAGFIGFLDPPKETAAPALKALAAQGVAVKILTGDNDLVTRKVCRDVGLDVEHIVLGSELAGLDDAAVGAIADGAYGVRQADARRQGAHRARAASARGHTVGFLGDGINDAGALREADVGISVDSAVDIAKESADIILLEKSLMVLEEGVVEGRRPSATPSSTSR